MPAGGAAETLLVVVATGALMSLLLLCCLSGFSLANVKVAMLFFLFGPKAEVVIKQRTDDDRNGERAVLRT